jgi:hypothetical protein
MSDKQTLVLAWVASGAALAILQLVIWWQVNDRLPPQQQIGWQALRDTFAWFREDGLLAQHARLFPGSRLTTVFRVLWGTFWVLVAFWILVR